jgi:hypothetical protein
MKGVKERNMYGQQCQHWQTEASRHPKDPSQTAWLSMVSCPLGGRLMKAVVWTSFCAIGSSLCHSLQLQGDEVCWVSPGLGSSPSFFVCLFVCFWGWESWESWCNLGWPQTLYVAQVGLELLSSSLSLSSTGITIVYPPCLASSPTFATSWYWRLWQVTLKYVQFNPSNTNWAPTGSQVLT